MVAAESQFEVGRRKNYIGDFYSEQYSWNHDRESFWRPRSKKFEYSNSTETSENSKGYVFRVPLSEVTIENLKIIPKDAYIIVQSNRKTIFIRLEQRIKPKTLSILIKGSILIIAAEKL